MSEGAERIAEVAVPILVVMLCGWLSMHFKLFPAEALWTFNLFVFTFGIPALVFKGLAQQDLTDIDWDFALVFLILRLFFGLLAAIVTLVVRTFDYPGEFILNYIGTTWINTIIFGIPMLASLYGPGVAVLNVLAALSSLIFQLPLMLAILEFRKVWYPREIVTLDSQTRKNSSVELEVGKTENKGNGVAEAEISATTKKVIPKTKRLSSVGDIAKDTKNQVDLEHADLEGMEDAQTKGFPERERLPVSCKIVWNVVRKVFTTPPMIGIILGFLYSFIVVHANEYTDFAEPEPAGFGLYLNNFVDFFGITVTPLATFTVGMFSYGRLHHFRNHLLKNIIFIICKMFLMPLLAVGVCFWLDIDGIEARSAVLIASLPIALASFSLVRNYYRQEDVISVISAQIVIGTILMIATFTAWNEYMDANDLFGEIPSDAMYIPRKPKK
mmetsp:Transcript_11433/g.28151  ORF Transcript_11433/g.28151 Transcript_11433/m.28151 type:complete len:442 (-) Transcript_11433:68-1393(-)